MFGILGFGFMIFAGLLSARKRVRVWRAGRAQTWMRGHLWLGLLSLPLILFHGGFHFGGPLTSVLMWLLMITVASGLFGAALQHYLPRVMTSQAPMETIFDEIEGVRAQLLAEADRYVSALCGPLRIASAADGERQRAGGFSAARPAAAAAPSPALPEEQAAPLRSFYRNDMRPFLTNPRGHVASLSSKDQAHRTFEHLCTLLPPATHETLKDLENICDEQRQLALQMRLHHWLHGWLLVHAPLSFALLLLGAVHTVMALRY